MKFSEWVEKYKPVKTEDNRVYAFETYSDLSQYGKHQIWTLIDGEGEEVILSGWHWCNRLNYFITEIPYDGELIEIAITDNDLIYYGM